MEPEAVTVCSLAALITQLFAAVRVCPCEIVHVSQACLFVVVAVILEGYELCCPF